MILAGGKGTRMNGNGDSADRNHPKVLCRIHNNTLIEHLLEHLFESKLSIKPTVVVGYGADYIRRVLGDRVNYAIQEQQKGTGHAAMCAKAALEGECSHVLVLYGDHPYVPAYIINELVSLHKGQQAILTHCTTIVPDFEVWRKDFYSYGRIIRNVDGEIEKIVEMKDATPEELKIKELNVGYYCFNAEWLWKNLASIEPSNAQNEYYLTDLLEIALSQRETVKSLTIDPMMSVGVNTPEQLAQAEKLLFRK